MSVRIESQHKSQQGPRAVMCVTFERCKSPGRCGTRDPARGPGPVIDVGLDEHHPAAVAGTGNKPVRIVHVIERWAPAGPRRAPEQQVVRASKWLLKLSRVARCFRDANHDLRRWTSTRVNPGSRSAPAPPPSATSGRSRRRARRSTRCTHRLRPRGRDRTLTVSDPFAPSIPPARARAG